MCLVFSSVYIVTQFAPAAAGSGIPEIKGYLNGKPAFITASIFLSFFLFRWLCILITCVIAGVDAHGILLFRTLVGKVLYPIKKKSI